MRDVGPSNESPAVRDRLQVLAEMRRSKVELRDYQKECLEAIEAAGDGRHLVHLATGLGKTVVFTHMERHGRVLLLSHRDELVRQPVRYYDVPVGIEKADESSDGEEVVSASVQTLARDARLARFKPGDFHTVITDEAHHAAAPSYRKIIDHLQPARHIGFTATPKRGDDRGLADVYDDIVFSRDLKWGIKHGWLANIDAQRVYVDWDTRAIKRQHGDFNLHDLDLLVNKPSTNEQIAAAYGQFAKGQTLLFASSVEHAWALAKLIENSAVVDGKTPASERREILDDFRKGGIGCLINYGVFTEGTDLPMVNTVLLARPTQNPTLYTQMVGRGLRLDAAAKKTSVRLIDCVGVTRDARLCTAPTLMGLNEDEFPQGADRVINGNLMTLASRLQAVDDTPEGWVLRARKIDLLASPIAWVRSADGSKRVSGNTWTLTMSSPDDLGAVDLIVNERIRTHYASDEEAEVAALSWLSDTEPACRERKLWDAAEVALWGAAPATAKQIKLMNLLASRAEEELPSFDLNKYECAIIIDNLTEKIDKKLREEYGACPICGAPMTVTKSGNIAYCSRARWKSSGPGRPPRLTGPCTFHFFLNYFDYRFPKTAIKTFVSGEAVPVDGELFCLTVPRDDEECCPGIELCNRERKGSTDQDAQCLS